MVRSLSIGLGLTVLAVTGLAWGQVLPPGTMPAGPKEHTLTIQETDKSPLKCKVLKMWQEPDGRKAFQVQAVSSGEMITVVQPAPGSGEPGKTVATKIYHWGDKSKPPAGAPEAPKDATASPPFAPAAPAAPASSGVESSKAPYPPNSATDLAKAPAPGQQRPGTLAPDRPDTQPAKDAATTLATKRTSTTESKPAAPAKVWPPAYAPEIPTDEPRATTLASGPATKPASTPTPTKSDKPAATTLADGPAPKPATMPTPTKSDKPAATTLADGPVTKPATTPTPTKDVAMKKAEPAPKPTIPVTPAQTNSSEPRKTVVVKDPPTPVKPTPAAPVIPPPVTTAPKPGVTEIVRTDVPKPPAPSVVTIVPSASTTPPPMPIIVHGTENKAQPELSNKSPIVISGHDNETSTVVRVPSKIVTPVVESVSPVTPAAPKKVDQGEQPKQGPALVQNPAPLTQPAPKVVTSAEPPKPSDWRQSWGHVEPQPPAQPTRTVVKTETPRKTDGPAKIDLPHANTTKPDPLQTPDRYVRVPTPGGSTVKPQPASDSPKPLQLAKNSAEAESSSLKPPAMHSPDLTQPDNGSTAAKTGDIKPSLPLGMGSVAAAQLTEPDVVLPPSSKPPPAAQTPSSSVWDGGNAFTAPQPPPTAPRPGKAALLPANYAQGNLPLQPAAPPPPPMPIPMDRGVSSGMANAFTNGGSARPLPAEFGEPSQSGNAFSPPYPNMAPPQAAMQQMPANPYQGSSMLAMADRRQPAQAPVQMDQGPSPASNTPQLLAVLRDSLYPSQREWAVESLVGQRGSKTQPQVVQGLLSAAKDDPAATVRACCVRAIAQLQVNTVPAVTLVQSLRNDPDPRVRREAEQALPALTGGQPLLLDSSVRPVSGH